jgi:hypothetical protein
MQHVSPVGFPTTVTYEDILPVLLLLLLLLLLTMMILSNQVFLLLRDLLVDLSIVTV